MLQQVEFKTAGTYYIEVLVDDVMKLRYPVAVIHAPPPQPRGRIRNRRSRAAGVTRLSREASGVCRL